MLTHIVSDKFAGWVDNCSVVEALELVEFYPLVADISRYRLHQGVFFPAVGHFEPTVAGNHDYRSGVGACAVNRRIFVDNRDAIGQTALFADGEVSNRLATDRQIGCHTRQNEQRNTHDGNNPILDKKLFKKIFYIMYNYLLPNSYSPYQTLYNFDDEAMLKKINALLESMGYEGLFEIEFIVDEIDNKYFYISNMWSIKHDFYTISASFIY